MANPVRTPAPTRTDIVRANKEANLPAGVTSPKAKEMINERKVRNALAQQIRGTTWGINDQRTALAVADYCYTNRIDPIRHVEILGGRIYLTATFYQEAGARLIAQGKVTKIEVDHIGIDARLDTQYAEGMKFAEEAQALGDEAEASFWIGKANEARREIGRRRMLRVEHNANEKAAAVCVVRIWPADMAEPIEGCNWCGNGIRKDPVGDAESTKTSETRAARRAWKQLCTVLPSAAPAVLLAEEEGVALTEVLDEARRLSAGDEVEDITPQSVQRDDPYGIGSDAQGASNAALASEPVKESVDEDLELDRQLLVDEARESSPPGSKSMRMPKPGAVQDAFALGGEKRSGKDALREG